MIEFTTLDFWRRGGASLFESELKRRAEEALQGETLALAVHLLGQEALPVLRGLLAELGEADGEVLASLDNARADLAAASERVAAIERDKSEAIRLARDEKGPWPPEYLPAIRARENAEFRVRKAEEAARLAETMRHRLTNAIGRLEGREFPDVSMIRKLADALA